jgi:hypothetical protein
MFTFYLICNFCYAAYLRNLKPEKFKIKNFIDKNGNVVSKDKACYILLECGGKVKIKKEESYADSVYCLHDTKRDKYHIYEENKINTGTEDLLASLYISKHSLRFLIIPLVYLIACLLFNIPDLDLVEMNRLSQIQQERIEELKTLDKDVLRDATRIFFISSLMLDSTPEKVSDYQHNIYIIDSCRYLSGVSDDLKPVYSNNKVRNIFLDYSCKVTKESLDVLTEYSNGYISEEEAVFKVKDIIRPLKYMQYTLLVLNTIITGYTYFITSLFLIRYLFYILYKKLTEKEFV